MTVNACDNAEHTTLHVQHITHHVQCITHHVQHITLHVQQVINRVIQPTMHSEFSNETPIVPSVTEQVNHHFTGNDAITAENQRATSGEGDRGTHRYTVA